jgi:hypothetical protein
VPPPVTQRWVFFHTLLFADRLDTRQHILPFSLQTPLADRWPDHSTSRASNVAIHERLLKIACTNTVRDRLVGSIKKIEIRTYLCAQATSVVRLANNGSEVSVCGNLALQCEEVECIKDVEHERC